MTAKVRRVSQSERDLCLLALEQAQGIVKAPARQCTGDGRRAVKDLAWLEKKLELSKSWDGVPVTAFYEKVTAELIAEHLKQHGFECLGEFIQKPYAESVAVLRAKSFGCPLALRKLHERYHAAIMN